MILLDKNRIHRTLKRMSYQIIEEAKGGDVWLAGINERGHAVAGIIKEYTEEATGKTVPLYRLDEEKKEAFHFSTTPGGGQTLIIIDDVVFSGQTIFSTIQKVQELSGFKKICICVLADRGHRKFPLLAEIVGLHVPTKLNEHVELKLKDGKPTELVLIKK